ncbi:unnamed protein product [Phytomonas sp. Hart1]|nr:unnamed protein product [Phytomonas sp. Hart1]|eukprot:CCW70640.1 unnamed protein product [Phytomonas sp. isolate Hart1]
MSSFFLLDAGFQNYDWGKPASESFVAKMKGLSSDDSGKNYAELWVGTHSSCPSRLSEGSKPLLASFFEEDKNRKRYFSPAHEASKFRRTVPFLLKILSIKKTLSIQAHPNKALAEKLYATSPDKYKDPNHKPELICALTPFEALCCFRPLNEIVAFLRRIPSLAKMVSAEEVLSSYLDIPPILPEKNSNEEKGILKSLMKNLYTTNAEDCVRELRIHLKHLKSSKPPTQCVEDGLFVRFYEQYPDDVGCWMAYFLNYVQLQPGQALFMSDSEPHAYISGDGVEIMACSDNVVRGGLTPKWKDVKLLIEMLRYDTTGLDSAMYQCRSEEDPNGWQVQIYNPPSQFPDFSLYRLQNSSNEPRGKVLIKIPSIGLGFCLEGEAMINGSKVKAGDCFAVSYGDVTCEALNRKTLIFVSSTNELSKL